MSGSHQSTRLGDLLVEKGKISREQLYEAIRFQQERRSVEAQDEITGSAKSELGEILIELGFISREQLNSSLSWQKRLRKTTLVMTFVAPLLTAACGGGGAGGAPSSSTGISDNTLNISNSSVASVSNGIAISSSSISSNRSSSSTSSQSWINGPVVINWTAPTHRENGDYLDITEVGGYQIRYKLKSAAEFTSITIDNGYTDSYYFNNLNGDYEFEIAAYDQKGLYSDFVKINYR